MALPLEVELEGRVSPGVEVPAMPDGAPPPELTRDGDIDYVYLERRKYWMILVLFLVLVFTVIVCVVSASNPDRIVLPYVATGGCVLVLVLAFMIVDRRVEFDRENQVFRITEWRLVYLPWIVKTGRRVRDVECGLRQLSNLTVEGLHTQAQRAVVDKRKEERLKREEAEKKREEAEEKSGVNDRTKAANNNNTNNNTNNADHSTSAGVSLATARDGYAGEVKLHDDAHDHDAGEEEGIIPTECAVFIVAHLSATRVERFIITPRRTLATVEEQHAHLRLWKNYIRKLRGDPLVASPTTAVAGGGGDLAAAQSPRDGVDEDEHDVPREVVGSLPPPDAATGKRALPRGAVVVIGANLGEGGHREPVSSTAGDEHDADELTSRASLATPTPEELPPPEAAPDAASNAAGDEEPQLAAAAEEAEPQPAAAAAAPEPSAVDGPSTSGDV